MDSISASKAQDGHEPREMHDAAEADAVSGYTQPLGPLGSGILRSIELSELLDRLLDPVADYLNGKSQGQPR
jgi:hypothetical protein